MAARRRTDPTQGEEEVAMSASAHDRARSPSPGRTMAPHRRRRRRPLTAHRSRCASRRRWSSASWPTGDGAVPRARRRRGRSGGIRTRRRARGAACADGAVRLFDVTPAATTGVEHRIRRLRRIAWSPDSTLLAGGHYEPFVILFDAQSDSSPATLDPDLFSDEGRTAVAFSPDGAPLASTAYNALVRWSLPAIERRKIAGRRSAEAVGEKAPVSRRLAFAADGAALAALAETEGRHDAACVDRRRRAEARRTLALPRFSQRLAWAFDSSLIAVTEHDAPGLSLWDPAALGPSALHVEGNATAMAAIAAHPKPWALVAGTEDGGVVIWERTERAS